MRCGVPPGARALLWQVLPMPRPTKQAPGSVQFDFDRKAIRSADEPGEPDQRLFFLFLELLRHSQAAYEPVYRRRFERDEKTFKRDINKLRALGRDYGFELTPMAKLTVRLKKSPHERSIPNAPADGADVLRAVAVAFGDVVAASIGSVVDIGGSNVDRFLHVASPRLVAETAVGETYRTLRSAWASSAMVRFRYPDATGSRSRERTVEPYATTYYAGRYYLVGWDVRPRVGWRQFALDRIEGRIARAGTFRKRAIPPAYRGDDAIGLFKTDTQSTTDVTVELSPRIAGAVTARTWQARQRFELRADGSALFTFEVYDLGEAVRWAFGFGVEAAVVAPPKAVDLARETIARMAGRYVDRASSQDRRSAS